MAQAVCKVLLVNPPYTRATYETIDRKAGTLQNPVISLATVATPLLDDGCEVRIADLDLEDQPYRCLTDMLTTYRPDYVGVTGTTPMVGEMARIARITKTYCRQSVTVCGGVHVTTFPREMLEETEFDIAVIGEGDFTLRDIIRAHRREDVQGVAFKRGGQVALTEPRPLLNDLDELPLPAWQLFDLKRYSTSKLVERRSPTGLLETSRGCIFSCPYCNKNIFGRRFRHKSVRRTVDEMEYMSRAGFREIHVQDDGFSTDLAHAKAICAEILRRGRRFLWALHNGIRVDRVDPELFTQLRRAGCYQIGLGIESGNQAILDRIQKGISKDQIRAAVALVRKAGMESYGFFMLALPGETELTMQDTIRFAVELDLDIAKFAVTIPLPGTPLFEEYDRAGRILTRDWSQYLFHNLAQPVYRHPNLDWDTIVRYYKKAYRAFYFRPKLVARRVCRGIATGGLLHDLRYCLRTKWW